jgi:NAD(P)-dependent dehydrogenase (short-subunit alcohol dehydrogenase family)
MEMESIKTEILKEYWIPFPCFYVDVRDYGKYDEVVAQVDKSTGGKGLSLLINNAGITSKYARLNQVKKESLMDNFEINTVGPILMTKVGSLIPENITQFGIVDFK